MKATRKRRVWLLAASVAVVAAALAGAWQLLPFTGIGVPDDRYPTTPEPCELLGEETLRELVGDAPGERIATTGSGWRPAVYRETILRCEWSRPQSTRPLTVTVERFVAARFGLGPTGAEKAEDYYGSTGCDRGLAGGRDDACVRGWSIVGTWMLHVRRANVVVEVEFTQRETPSWDPDELLGRMAEDILSRLDEN